MHVFLHHDQEAGELRLVFADLWGGQHERTEFQVLDGDGRTIRRGQEFDGLTEYRDSFGGYYVKLGTSVRPFATGKTAVAESKTACRRQASRSGRARCSLCDGA